MHRRLILSMLAVVLVVVTVLGVPLAIIESRAIERSTRDALKADASRLLETTALELRASGPSHEVDVSRLDRQVAPSRYALVQLPDGRMLHIGKPLKEAHPIIERLSGVQGESVTVMESRHKLDDEVRTALLLIFGVALLAIAAAVVLAVMQARRLTQPLVDLAETAERLGSGDARPRHRRYGVVELDRVAEVLDASAERIARMLTAERRLAADASHQLRTPLTALSMRLEEIVATDDLGTVKEEASVALTQVERLTDVVQRLLTDARDAGSASAVSLEVDQVIRQQVDEWRPAYEAQRRRVAVAGVRGLRAVASPGALSQVLATLLENALIHGAGTVTVRTRITGTSVVVEVSDVGEGVPPEFGARVFERAVSGRNSTGLGLAVARDLAEADGGRLELLQQRPPVFAVFLAVAADEPGDFIAEGHQLSETRSSEDVQ